MNVHQKGLKEIQRMISTTTTRGRGSSASIGEILIRKDERGKKKTGRKTYCTEENKDIPYRNGRSKQRAGLRPRKSTKKQHVSPLQEKGEEKKISMRFRKTSREGKNQVAKTGGRKGRSSSHCRGSVGDSFQPSVGGRNAPARKKDG